MKMSLLGLVCLAAACHAPDAAAPPAGIFVSNEMSGTVTELDPVSFRKVRDIFVGTRPRGMAASADGRYLFVALSGSPIRGPGVDESTLPPPDKLKDGIGVVDLKTRRLVRVVHGASDPETVSITLDGKTLLAASEDSGRAIFLNAMNGAILATLAVGEEPEGVAISPNGRIALITSEAENSVSLLDMERKVVLATLKAGQRPRGIAFSPDGARAYVTGENDASLSVIKVARRAVETTITIRGENVRPMGVTVSSDGRHVFVTLGRAGEVAKLDARTLRETARARVGARPWGVALSPDGARLIVANGPSGGVTILDSGTLSPLATVQTGERPWGVIYAGQRYLH